MLRRMVVMLQLAAATATQTTSSGPDSATQTTGNTAATQTAGAATQNADAQQAAGGVGNIGVSSPQQTVSGLPNFQIQYFAPGKDGELVAPTLKMTPGQQAPMAGPGDMPLPQSQSSDDAAASAIADKSRQFTMNSRVVGQHLADWAKTRFLDAVKNGDKSIAAYMDDYNKWARENGKEPLDVLTMYEAMKRPRHHQELRPEHEREQETAASATMGADRKPAHAPW